MKEIKAKSYDAFTFLWHCLVFAIIIFLSHWIFSSLHELSAALSGRYDYRANSISTERQNNARQWSYATEELGLLSWYYLETTAAVL